MRPSQTLPAVTTRPQLIAEVYDSRLLADYSPGSHLEDPQSGILYRVTHYAAKTDRFGIVSWRIYGRVVSTWLHDPD